MTLHRGDVVVATNKEDMVQNVMDLTGVRCPALHDTDHCTYQKPKCDGAPLLSIALGQWPWVMHAHRRLFFNKLSCPLPNNYIVCLPATLP